MWCSQIVSRAAVWPHFGDSQGPSLPGSLWKEEGKEEENLKEAAWTVIPWVTDPARGHSCATEVSPCPSELCCCLQAAP